MAYPHMLHTLGLEKNGFLLAAAYFYHIIQNHPFIDGNKRIGTLASPPFLIPELICRFSIKSALYKYHTYIGRQN